MASNDERVYSRIKWGASFLKINSRESFVRIILCILKLFGLELCAPCTRGGLVGITEARLQAASLTRHSFCRFHCRNKPLMDSCSLGPIPNFVISTSKKSALKLEHSLEFCL